MLFSAVAVLAAGIGRPDVSKTVDDSPTGLSAATRVDPAQASNPPSGAGGSQQAQYAQARQLEREGMPTAALIELLSIVKAGPSQPFYSQALDRLTLLQGALGDEYLIPTVISAEPVEHWTSLDAATRARAAYLAAKVAQRRGDLQKARSLLDYVPPSSEVFALSRYLLGVIEMDPKLPGGPRPQRAIRAFEDVLSAAGDQQNLARVQQLAVLGLGRVHYGAGEFAKSVQWYERIPRFSAFWDQGLFEAAFAHFQNGDPGSALGSLQSLHAPQFAGAFQPESWILTATIYYFNCLYDETKGALASFDASYLPMLPPLEAALGSNETELLELFMRGERLPRPVLLWILGNERVQGILRMISKMDRDIEVLERRSRSGDSTADLLPALRENRATLAQVGARLVRNRVEEAASNLKGFADQAEIIRFETAKAEKELAESGVDQQALLRRQNLLRPALPSDAWEYWKFDGEFWLDEIGYYRFTLKRGCPTR